MDTPVSYVDSVDATVPEVTHLINTAMDTVYGGTAGQGWEPFLWKTETGTAPQQTMACMTEAVRLPCTN